VVIPFARFSGGLRVREPERGKKENGPGENGAASIDIVAAAGESFFAASRLTINQTSRLSKSGDEVLRS
jgi:hypothetical protein